MNYIKILDKLLGDTVERLFIIMFSPGGEDDMGSVDIQLGLVMNKTPNQLVVIRTDRYSDSPTAAIEELPNIYFQEEDFYIRRKKWMNSEFDEEEIMWYEYYDFSNSSFFKNIVKQKVDNIQLFGRDIWDRRNFEPFGMKIIFKKDFILSFPNLDGNTIETKSFNKNGNLENYINASNIVYKYVSLFL